MARDSALLRALLRPCPLPPSSHLLPRGASQSRRASPPQSCVKPPSGAAPILRAAAVAPLLRRPGPHALPIVVAPLLRRPLPLLRRAAVELPLGAAARKHPATARASSAGVRGSTAGRAGRSVRTRRWPRRAAVWGAPPTGRPQRACQRCWPRRASGRELEMKRRGGFS